jgi:DNA-binding MarR family transcriptional regulator
MDTSLLFDVFALNQSVARFLEAAMWDGPLTPGEYAVYSAIFELEAASPTAIAARLGMRLTTFMDRLRSIEQRGHARRIGDPADRRSYRVTLTAEGRAAHAAANRAFEAAHAAIEIELARGDVDASQASARARRALNAVREAADHARARFAPEARVATPLSAGRAG